VLGVAPGEVGVGLGKAELGEAVHDLGPRERLGEEDRVRVFALQLGDRPFPERKRLGVRVVDAEDPHAFGRPAADDRSELRPQRAPFVRFEFEREDVLVFLGRVLRVLHRAVRAPAEPFRMLGHVGMVGGALERDVQRDLDAPFARAREQAPEILDRSKLGVDRLVAAFGRADRPGTACVLRERDQRVVPALAVDAADGMDGRKVQHVEAHLRDIGQPRLAVAEGPVPRGLARRRAREHLVPGGEARPLAIDDERILDLAGDRETAVGMPAGDRGKLFVQADALQVRELVRLAQLRGPAVESLAVLAPGASRGGFDEARADQRRDAKVLVLDAARKIVAPGEESVDPRGDGVAIRSRRLRDEGPAPAVVADRDHRRFLPARAFLAPPQQKAGDRIVPVAEAVGLDDDALARDALGRESPAVDRRRDVLDHRAGAPLGRHRRPLSHAAPRP